MITMIGTSYDDYRRKQRHTANRYTARCTSFISVVLQCKLVSGWWLKKSDQLRLTGFMERKWRFVVKNWNVWHCYMHTAQAYSKREDSLILRAAIDDGLIPGSGQSGFGRSINVAWTLPGLKYSRTRRRKVDSSRATAVQLAARSCREPSWRDGGRRLRCGSSALALALSTGTVTWRLNDGDSDGWCLIDVAEDWLRGTSTNMMVSVYWVMTMTPIDAPMLDSRTLRQLVMSPATFHPPSWQRTQQRFRNAMSA